MNKLDMSSKELVNDNIYNIGKLFPNCIIEGKIDFDALKQELSKDIVDNKKEKYQLTWVGKKESILEANTPVNKTLRPVKEKSVDFDKTKNIYIEGDNLEVLKILQESYLNKIKCIYIDPPYNTGNDFIYNDDFSKSETKELSESGQIDEYNNRLTANTDANGKYHSDWLSMMYPRLKLARNLLTNDGVIFISIDNNELFNLKRLCDEIFGESSFVANIGVEITKTQGMKVKAAQEGSVVKNYEYIMCYCKNNNSKKIVKNVLYDENSSYDSHFNRYIDLNTLERKNIIDLFQENGEIRREFEKYNLPIKMQNIDSLLLISEKFRNILYGDLSKNIFQEMACNINVPNDIKEKLKNGSIVKFNDYLLNLSSGGKMRQFSSLNATLNYSDEYFAKYGRVTIRGDLWKGFYSDMMNVAKEGNTNFLNGKKPIRLIYQLIKWIGLSENDIILDFFSGSATTAHAVMKWNIENHNLKYVLVQLPEKCSEVGENYETICDLGEERIRRAAKKIKEDTNADIDYGFRVYRVDSSNMKDVYYEPSKLDQTQLNMFESNIKEDRNAEDLLTQVILDLGLTLDLNIEEKNILNNKVYFVAENSLVACFDNKININILDEICKIKPLKIVFRESSFNSDSEKINAYERIKKLSPETEINVM